MFVNDVYNLMQDIINKNQGSYLPPDKFNRLINVGSRSYLSYLIGIPETYQYGRPIARVELGQNSILRQKLTPFISSPTTLTIDGNGQCAYPDDYIIADAMYYGTSKKRVKFIQQDRLDSHYNSEIDPIATNPVYLIIDAGFQFYPLTLSSAQLSYVKNPPSIVYGFTLDGNGREVYDAGTSVQPLWSDIDIFEVIVRALQPLGVSIQAPQVQQYSQMIKTAGQ